ncbi:hypothetical protein BB347_02835 [Natronorubrum daqingense]|nr:hypothetical protein BB347_02835 [Natronorubrum daqingense]
MTTTQNHQRCRPEGSDDPASSGREARLSQDEIFHILQTNRRRDAISYLVEKRGPVKMSDVAEYVAAREHGTTVEELTSTQRQRVYIPLYQSHLPKLDEKGIIDYNKPRGIVEPTDRISVFEPYLEPPETTTEAESEHSPTSQLTSFVDDYYVSSVCMSTVLLAATAFGVFQIPQLLLAVSIVGLFTLATIATMASETLVTSDSVDPHSTH